MSKIIWRRYTVLAKADISIESFLPFFASTGLSVAFLVPTETGYKKSIMDATASVRYLLKSENVHDYEGQLQGPENKKLVETYFVTSNNTVSSCASLYRPVTKKGDPRIWFSNLKKYCQPCNLLALLVLDGKIFVFNLSNPQIATSLLNKGYAYDIIQEGILKSRAISDELLSKIREIHQLGFIKSVTKGDPGVGDTLEHALGIERNNKPTPDYKGIELKTKRIKQKSKTKTRNTLFTQVPDEGMTYRQIVEKYGKWQTPKNSKGPKRLQLYETFRVSRSNAYDLQLAVEEEKDRLDIVHYNQTSSTTAFVSAWYISHLKSRLEEKHSETFWVKATAEYVGETEYFRYDEVFHTRKPNTSLIVPLLEKDIITIDLAAHFEPDGKWRDHGVLFKMKPKDLPLLFGETLHYVF